MTRETMRERETLVPYPRPASPADMLTEALRLSGVDVSVLTAEQIAEAAETYHQMSLRDVTARVRSIRDHQRMIRNLVSSDGSTAWARYDGAVVALDAALTELAIEEVSHGG